MCPYLSRLLPESSKIWWHYFQFSWPGLKYDMCPLAKVGLLGQAKSSNMVRIGVIRMSTAVQAHKHN